MSRRAGSLSEFIRGAWHVGAELKFADCRIPGLEWKAVSCPLLRNSLELRCRRWRGFDDTGPLGSSHPAIQVRPAVRGLVSVCARMATLSASVTGSITSNDVARQSVEGFLCRRIGPGRFLNRRLWPRAGGRRFDRYSLVQTACSAGAGVLWKVSGFSVPVSVPPHPMQP